MERFVLPNITRNLRNLELYLLTTQLELRSLGCLIPIGELYWVLVIMSRILMRSAAVLLQLGSDF